MSERIENQIERYETLLRELWAASERYLGTFAVKLLVERVVWEVSSEYREIELMQYNQDGISCSQIAAKWKDNPDLPVYDMFEKFIKTYLEILSRLLGREKAEKIKESVGAGG